MNQMDVAHNRIYYERVIRYLKRRSKEICEDNHCTENVHNCGSHAYFEEKETGGFMFIEICLPDYLTYKPDTFISLPVAENLTVEELITELNDNVDEEDDERLFYVCDIGIPKPVFITKVENGKHFNFNSLKEAKDAASEFCTVGYVLDFLNMRIINPRD